MHSGAEKIQLDSYRHFLKPRPHDWHKGLSGHVLVIGGDYGYFGAPHLAAEAALRVGAGLVSIATRIENALTLNINRPELMCHGIAKAKDLAPLITKADVIILGPGLGQSDWSKEIWQFSITQTKPMILDADGLNLLAKANQSNTHWILTPHPGEAARLLETTTENIQHDRLSAVKTIQKRYGGVCILKGAGSLICSENALPAICEQGNPGMATAGMGDVLSGVIGSLVAQGIPLTEAAKLGVCLHAVAGDLAAKQGERGMIASDLMPYLRRLSNEAGSSGDKNAS